LDVENLENVVVLDGDPSVPILMLCEHAGNAIPEEFDGLGLSASDLSAHWAYDPGILGVFEAAQREARCVAIRARLSRLLCDLNREPTSSQLMRPVIGTGVDPDPFRPVPGNQDFSARERLRRLRAYYRPYHAAVDRAGDELAARRPDFYVVSFHSFTPEFGKEDRAFEVGLLFDDDGRFARSLQGLLQAHGLRTRLNEPYSGLRGENFSPRMHAEVLGCHQIEVEVNQGHLVSAEAREETGAAIATALRHLLVHG
jgi:predicted N-formylglutamate amidohydrolase